MATSQLDRIILDSMFCETNYGLRSVQPRWVFSRDRHLFSQIRLIPKFDRGHPERGRFMRLGSHGVGTNWQFWWFFDQ